MDKQSTGAMKMNMELCVDARAGGKGMKGAAVDAADKNGNTPLHLSIEKGHRDLTLLLLSKGAKVNAINKAGYTPLKLALENGQNDMAMLLRDYGALE